MMPLVKVSLSAHIFMQTGKGAKGGGSWLRDRKGGGGVG